MISKELDHYVVSKYLFCNENINDENKKKVSYVLYRAFS